MKAMILAAGLGTRMAPLTDHTPKPLLQAGGHALIEWHLLKLAQAGISQVVINHHHLGEQLERALGDGSRYGVPIVYSREAVRLETAGGIIKALPLLQDERFIVVNADIWSDYDYSSLPRFAASLSEGRKSEGRKSEGRKSEGRKSEGRKSEGRKSENEKSEHENSANKTLAHLILVPNAAHHPQGDFYLQGEGKLSTQLQDGSSDTAPGAIPGTAPATGTNKVRHTFSGISVMHRQLFAGYPEQPQPLLPLLLAAMQTGSVTGELYTGEWWDIGTPERLAALDAMLADRKCGAT